MSERVTEKLEEIVSSVRDLMALVSAQLREAKRSDGLLRKAIFSNERLIDEKMSVLRASATDLVEKQLREALRVASDTASAEPSGAQRAAAQRVAAHWGAWQRTASAHMSAEWMSSLRSLGDLAGTTLKETLNPALHQSTAELGALQRCEGALTDLQHRVAEALAVYEQTKVRSKVAPALAVKPRPARRSVPKRSIDPKKG